MDVEKTVNADTIVITPKGAIDHNTAAAFEVSLLPAIEEAGNTSGVVIDMDGVDYMSSVGLRVLMLAAKAAKQGATPISVCRLGDTLSEIFQISRFDKLFTIHDGLDEAIAATRP
ncbi:MAG: STAS domain-containing protein [Alphaproteobacteria bacterium]